MPRLAPPRCSVVGSHPTRSAVPVLTDRSHLSLRRGSIRQGRGLVVSAMLSVLTRLHRHGNRPGPALRPRSPCLGKHSLEIHSSGPVTFAGSTGRRLRSGFWVLQIEGHSEALRHIQVGSDLSVHVLDTAAGSVTSSGCVTPTDEGYKDGHSRSPSCRLRAVACARSAAAECP